MAHIWRLVWNWHIQDPRIVSQVAATRSPSGTHLSRGIHD